MSQPYDFTILTDSSADLGDDLVREMDIQVLPLSFTIQDKTYHNYPDNRELDPHVFYQMLREGQTATTAAVNVEQYLQAMEAELQAGRDVLVPGRGADDAPLLVARGDWQVVKDAQRPVVHSVKSIYSLSKPSTKVGKRLYSFASVT